MTGGKHFASLRKGPWTYSTKDGEKVKKVEYKLIKSRLKHVKHGAEVFYNPYTGDTLLVRMYNKGKLIDQLAFKEAIIKEKTGVIIIHRDFFSFAVKEYTLAQAQGATNAVCYYLAEQRGRSGLH